VFRKSFRLISCRVCLTHVAYHVRKNGCKKTTFNMYTTLGEMVFTNNHIHISSSLHTLSQSTISGNTYYNLFLSRNLYVIIQEQHHWGRTILRQFVRTLSTNIKTMRFILTVTKVINNVIIPSCQTQFPSPMTFNIGNWRGSLRLWQVNIIYRC
jgi:hypothetical protein